MFSHMRYIVRHPTLKLIQIGWLSFSPSFLLVLPRYLIGIRGTAVKPSKEGVDRFFRPIVTLIAGPTADDGFVTSPFARTVNITFTM